MLALHNTLTRRKERFEPLEPGKVRLYVCGPTVYDYFHVGNARTFTVFDMVVRWLRASGYEVKYARNITDIDDKIIERARENNETMEALTARMIDAMHEDFDRLKLLRPDIEPRATRHVQGMLDLIAHLEKKGLAYRGGNGDVYYAVRQFEGYGKLSGKSLDDLRAGERVAVEQAKRDPLDFVLWKAAKPNEPKWPSIFGDGRPGWHIECSAMCAAEFGETLDIHGGGWDLQFPHHENEIAQSEGATGKPLARYWMHAAFLNFDSEKMSKSLGNFFTAREVLNKLDPTQGGEVVRFFLLRGHYRSEISYTWDTLMDARTTLLGFYTALKDTQPVGVEVDWTRGHAAEFKAAMDDDLNTPIAFAVLHELKNEVNRTKSPVLAGLLKALGGTIGLFQDDPAAFVQGKVSASDLDVDALVLERIQAKRDRNFSRADEIRNQLDLAGIALEDKPGGLTEWRKK
ncbi:MAG: cysteine--tRNA ligase [Betaproteobacteria bacterium]|nr:cysteine--tRNA ligase [Betaproteobacteria bacterium]